jgi:hypothetical protein
MFQNIFLKEYFKSPFLIWGFAVLFFTTFDALVLSYQVMEFILFNNLYIPILFGSMTIAIVFTTYPIRQGLRDLSRKKGHKISAILHSLLLLFVPYADAVFFLSDPFVILGTFQPQAITDKKNFDDIVLTKTLIQFIAMPLFSAYVLTNAKKELLKEDLDIHGKFRNNWKYVAYILGVNTGMYGVFLFIANNLS